MRKDIIGKSVWVLVDKSGYGVYNIDKSSKRLVVAVIERGHTLPDGSVNNDWCEHLIIQNSDGTLSEIKEYEAVICPEEGLGEDMMISRYLRDNICYPDEVYTNSEGNTIVSISYGDWKHDHMWCDDLMQYLGYKCTEEEVTEENGSDCYSADHYYVKVGV